MTRLAAGAGIVLTNAVGRGRLSHEALSAVRPDLIHLQVEGHHDGRAAVDYTVNAEIGFPLVTGPADHAGPVSHVLPAWDVACGLYAAVGLLAAERRRSRTGEGARIRLPLYDVALATAGNLGLLAEAQLGEERPRIGNHLFGGFGRDFAVAGDRYRHREALAALAAPWFAARTMPEVEDTLKGTSVLWAPYRRFSEVDLAGNPMMGEVDQPGVGRLRVPSSPLDAGNREAVPAPGLGEHTDEVLADLGLDAAGLRAKGVVA
nr:CoA transferase [Actinomadura rubrisoli]